MEESRSGEVGLSLVRWDLRKGKEFEDNFVSCGGCKGLSGSNGLGVLGREDR